MPTTSGLGQSEDRNSEASTLKMGGTPGKIWGSELYDWAASVFNLWLPRMCGAVLDVRNHTNAMDEDGSTFVHKLVNRSWGIRTTHGWAMEEGVGGLV